MVIYKDVKELPSGRVRIQLEDSDTCSLGQLKDFVVDGRIYKGEIVDIMFNRNVLLRVVPELGGSPF